MRTSRRRGTANLDTTNMKEQTMDSPRTTLRFAVPAALAVAFALALPGPAAAQKLDVKMGLWEATTLVQMSGTPPVDTSKLTPEQRTQMEAAMAASMKAAAKPHTFKQCLTKEKMAKGAIFQQHNDNCTQTVLADTTTELGVKFTCKANDGETTAGEWHFQATSPESVKGTGQMTMGRAGQSMSASSSVTAKWIGESCGSVK
jgi:hypothetical protein